MCWHAAAQTFAAHHGFQQEGVFAGVLTLGQFQIDA